MQARRSSSRIRHETQAALRAGPATSWRSTWLAAGLLVAATVASYSNSLHVPFVYDDQSDIVGNPSIRQLWPLRDLLVVRSDGRPALVSRPIVNISFAINHATGGLNTLHFHVTNLAIHAAAGCILFGFVRRTLSLAPVPDQLGDFVPRRMTTLSAEESRAGGPLASGAAATTLALTVALLWTLHPLQTESVTYLTQRYESLMGLCYLLTLYCAVRAATSAAPRRWQVAAVVSCWLAVGCKEVAISAPLAVLLYDRAFLAGTFREAWHQRRRLYLGLASAWVATAILLAFSSNRSGWAGYSLPIAWWSYALTQGEVLAYYLRLSVWPDPLILDYGWPAADSLGRILPGTCLLGGLFAATLYALWRRPKWGFCGACFFLVLGPTSSVLPLADLAVEHRMYLALAPVVFALVFGGYWASRRLAERGWFSWTAVRTGLLCLAGGAGVAAGVRTYQRNADYGSEVTLWRKTVAQVPDNARPHSNLGVALMLAGDDQEAAREFQRALEIRPQFARAHYGLGNALVRQGAKERAVEHYRQALELEPHAVATLVNLGKALLDLGRSAEALPYLQRAVEADPACAEAHLNLGAVLARQGPADEARRHFQRALALSPQDAQAHVQLGHSLVAQGRIDEGLQHFLTARELDPQDAQACYSLGVLQAQQGHIDQAIGYYQQTLAINANHAQAHNNLGAILAQRNRLDEAVEHYLAALKIKPDYVQVYHNLGNAQFRQGRVGEAIGYYRRALELDPQNAQAHFNLGVALYRQAQDSQALVEWREALRLQPQQVLFLRQTAWLLATSPVAAVRNGAEATALAERALQLAGARTALLLDTLAAAHAEAGRHARAVELVQEALALPATASDAASAAALHKRLRLYQSGTPFRDTRQAPAPAAKPAP